tara:strand:+ start:121 stop:315 length:195 start_codon:yes stop_codon:yes gene_type:complete
MKVPYLPTEKVLDIVNEVVNEYSLMLKNKTNPHEQKVGRHGAMAALKIRKELLKEISKRDSMFG